MFLGYFGLGGTYLGLIPHVNVVVSALYVAIGGYESRRSQSELPERGTSRGHECMRPTKASPCLKDTLHVETRPRSGRQVRSDERGTARSRATFVETLRVGTDRLRAAEWITPSRFARDFSHSRLALTLSPFPHPAFSYQPQTSPPSKAPSSPTSATSPNASAALQPGSRSLPWGCRRFFSRLLRERFLWFLPRIWKAG